MDKKHINNSKLHFKHKGLEVFQPFSLPKPMTVAPQAVIWPENKKTGDQTLRIQVRPQLESSSGDGIGVLSILLEWAKGFLRFPELMQC